MTRPALVFRYAAFAIVATIVNLVVQRLVLWVVYGDVALAVALLVGTAFGLIVKYVLDKRWVFYDRMTGIAAHGRKFTLYTLMGVVTTLIFWGAETSFWLVWRSDLMREVGAVLGLGVGYVVKYNLDRAFVFSSGAAAAQR